MHSDGHASQTLFVCCSHGSHAGWETGPERTGNWLKVTQLLHAEVRPPVLSISPGFQSLSPRPCLSTKSFLNQF